MSNDAIGGWFLNIGNGNNLSTHRDKQLQGRQVKKLGREKMSNDAIGGRILNIGNRNNLSTHRDKQLQGRLRVCERMSQQIGQRRGQRGLTAWHARTKMVNSGLVSPVVHGAYHVFTVADTSTFWVQRLGQGRSVVQMAACQLTAIIATMNCWPILNLGNSLYLCDKPSPRVQDFVTTLQLTTI